MIHHRVSGQYDDTMARLTRLIQQAHRKRRPTGLFLFHTETSAGVSESSLPYAAFVSSASRKLNCANPSLPMLPCHILILTTIIIHYTSTPLLLQSIDPGELFCVGRKKFGRDADGEIFDNDCIIDAFRISSLHLQIWREFDPREGPSQAAVRLKDTSTNGTYVRGHKVGKGNITILQHGDIIALAPDANATLQYCRRMFMPMICTANCLY